MLLHYISLNNEHFEAFCIFNTVWFDVVQISDNTFTNLFEILPVSTDWKPELDFINIEFQSKWEAHKVTCQKHE